MMPIPQMYRLQVEQLKAELDNMLLSSHLLLKNSDAKPALYDFFISHAWEDKDSFVRGLVTELEYRKITVWYDEFTLKIGDSLRQSIDHGLNDSRFGIVVLSPAFFKKGWTNYELNGLTTKEISGGKVILPIWHNVSKDEVSQYSQSLADKIALNTDLHSVSDIVDQLAEVIKP